MKRRKTLCRARSRKFEISAMCQKTAAWIYCSLRSFVCLLFSFLGEVFQKKGPYKFPKQCLHWGVFTVLPKFLGSLQFYGPGAPRSHHEVWLSLADSFESGNLGSPGVWKARIQKNTKGNAVIIMQIRSAKNVSNVLMRRKKIKLMAPFGAISNQFFHGPGKYKNP